MPDFGNTLVVTGGGLGDTLFHLPFMRSIQEHSANKSVVLACKKGREIRELFAEVDLVRSVLPVARNQDVSGQPDLFRVRRETRKAGIETAFIFHKSAGIAIAMMLAGVRNRYGYYFKGGSNRFFLNQGLLVHKDVPRPAFMNHAAMVMDKAGIAYDYSDVNFQQPDNVVRDARSRFPDQFDKPLIALGINASADFKQWGGEKYSTVAEDLLSQHDCRFLLFGAGDVRPVAAEILSKTVSPDSFLDLTTDHVPLHHSHALLQGCVAYIGNDSFGLNLAAMSNRPSIGIFADGHHFSYSDWITAVGSDTPDIHRVKPDRVLAAFSNLKLPGF